MKKKFRKLILPVSILVATQSVGLGLGGLQVDSNLDEALKGKIPLILSEDEISDNIKVSLANEKDYQKVGLDKSYVPSNIKVELVENEGEKFIKIYSKGPVSEPIVSLLLVVDWANGHLLREFTLLLDPPLFNQNLSTNNYSESVQTQKYEAPAKIEESIVEDGSSNQVDYSNTISEAAYTGSQQITVESGDTLWKIANNNRSGYASTQQVMVAIFNNNPTAFQNNDMNLLKKGAVLTVPDSDQINSISNSQAISEVSTQTRQWSQLQSENEYSADTSSSSDIDYGIELVPPNDKDDLGNAEGSSNSANNTKLIAELSQVKEKLASSSLESDELSSRVQELEQIIKDQELALSLKDTSLAQLQQQLSDEADKVEDDVWDDTGVASTDEMASTDEVVIKDVEQPQTQTQTQTNLPAQEVSFMDKLMSFKNEILMGLGALLLALVGFFFMKNRNKQDAVDGNDNFLDSISETDDSLTDLSLDSLESDLKEEIESSEEELSFDENDFNLDEALDDDNTELNLSTLEDEVVTVVENLEIEEEPDVIVMDDEIDLDLDLDDLEVEDLSEVETSEEENQEGLELDDNLDDLDIDMDDELSLDLDLDDAIDDELNLDSEELKVDSSDEVLEEEELDFGDDLDLSLDDIDFDEIEEVEEEVSETVSDGIDFSSENLDITEDDLDLSVDDSIQLAIDELDEETNETLEVKTHDEPNEDFDIGIDLDDVVDDAIDTKLDLARAYFEMGDVDGAKQMVDEVLEEGTEEQQSKAQELKSEIESS
jgi:pilus assembly protein FimV